FNMPLLRPGIDVAVHTECRMLSTAAGLDFKQHIILVQARGDWVAALRLWQSWGWNARGLERDDDFAFMFLSEEDAYAEGGAALAEAWLEVAGQAYERLMPAAVAVAEGPPVGRMLALNPCW
ncbi:unnamed protein product, partial [Effrenium voratum]